MIKKLHKYISKEKLFLIGIVIILLVSLLLRFYDFGNRYGLGDDDSRDLAIARVALERHEFPLIGSFSSAGPFVFGPLYYWFLMLCFAIFPWSSLSGHIGIEVAGLATVALFIYFGYLVGGKKLAVILGILAATSPQLVIRSLVVGQHSLVAPCAVAAFIFFTLLWQKKKYIFSLLLGLAIGTAISMHYQSVNLLIFLFPLFLVPKASIKQKLLYACLAVIGIVIAELPLLYWDSQQSYANFRNLLDYLLIAQYRLYVPNSWKLFLFTYLPSYWSFVSGGTKNFSIFLYVFTFLMTIYLILKRKASYLIVVLFGLFAVLLLVNKYYKGERSEGYLIYLAPFILTFTALALKGLLDSKNKILQGISIAVLIAIVVANIVQWKALVAYTTLAYSYNALANSLTTQYPDKKFMIYDYKGATSYVSQPLGFLIGEKKRIGNDGILLGVVCNANKDCPQVGEKVGTMRDSNIVVLDATFSAVLHEPLWLDHTPDGMYDDLIGESKKHNLKANFNLWDYLLHHDKK